MFFSFYISFLVNERSICDNALMFLVYQKSSKCQDILPEIYRMMQKEVGLCP